MSKKGKASKSQNVSRMLEIATRELAKGDFKSALRNAKMCYREAPDPSSRRLLEIASLRRVEQLHERGLSNEAKAVLAELLELGPTEAEVLAELPRLRVTVADSTINAEELFAKDPQLLVSLVDKAVLHERQAAPKHADMANQIAAVRQALGAVERGEDAAAIQLLEGIPRGSPLADWKLFVRGLSSFYQGDAQRSRQNWERLDSARPAARIAQTLMVARHEPALPNLSADVTRQVERLQNHLAPPGLFEGLNELSKLWNTADGGKFFRQFRKLRDRFITSQPKVIEDIVDLLCRRAVRFGDLYTMNEVIASVPPTSWDPQWNRLRAMVEEKNQRTDPKRVAQYWTEYAADLRTRIKLPPEERSIAVGLVYLRMGRFLAAEANEEREEREESAGSKSLIRDAIEAYEACLKAAPRMLEAYRELVELLEGADEPKRAAEICERLIAEFPDDVDAHYALADFFLQEDDAVRAAPHVAAMQRIAPRDRRYASLQWNQKLAEVRRLAKSKKYREAREAMIAAVQNAIGEIPPYSLAINLAAIAYRAKEFEVAEQHLAEALATVSEPTPIWLIMSYASTRYGLVREIKKRFDNLFKQAMDEKPTSESAGAVARHFLSMFANNLNYTGRATHQRLFIARLRRTRFTQWQQRDLESVGSFVMLLPRERTLKKKVITEGLRQFPKSAFFAMWAGEMEFADGAYYCDLDLAAEHFRQALEYASATPGFNSSLCESVRKKLSEVEDERSRPVDLFGFGGEFEDDDFEDDDFEADEFEEDGDVDLAKYLPPSFAGFPPPSGGGSHGEGPPSLPSGLAVEALINIAEKSLTKKMREEAEAAARQSGLSVRQVIENVLLHGRLIPE